MCNKVTFSCAPFTHDKILFPLRLSSFAEKLYFIWHILSITLKSFQALHPDEDDSGEEEAFVEDEDGEEPGMYDDAEEDIGENGAADHGPEQMDAD